MQLSAPDHARPSALPAAARSAYIHVPFCAHRCGYCNFTLIANRDDLADRYLAALECELQALEHPQAVDTLFLGGGTPTHLAPPQLERLLELATRWFVLEKGGEFSIEANPAGLDQARVEVLGRHGVNRVSLGAQSFAADKLRLLERDHLADDIRRAVRLLRPHVASLSLDLIFGVPGETRSLWQADLEAALALEPDHVSTYGLTFERGTTFWSRLAHGQMSRLDEELERTLYGDAIDTLSVAGREHYEVSNFARPGHRCRHNEVYWAGASYWAAGPGAARYVAGRREMNHRSTTTWIKRLLAGQSPVAETETLSSEDRARELLVLGLRRMEGVGRSDFLQRSGYELDALAGAALADYLRWGLMIDDGQRVRL
ncbi:MAG TPA: radical SAM family heme chaperone HemW, partial [Pirellulales bacterium]|nr:radical SAM family heme chaperone HemW [Pirellulales bacterium]